jgi:protein-disulfide isomerase
MRQALFAAFASFALAFPLACSGSGSSGAKAPSPAGGSPAADQVVAEVAGRAITLREVDERAAGGLQRLAQEQYEVRQQALDEIVSERLLDQEAAARGLTREKLLQAEVGDKVAAPSAEQVRTIYERSRDRLGDRPFAEIAPQIEQSLMEQARAEREADFQRQLRARNPVRMTLAPPRAAVNVPADAPALGPQAAPVTIVGFLDYQCPYCHRSQAVVERVIEMYKGKVRLVHQDFLLGRPRSLPAARAARCAGDQGRFWEYHRSLLTAPGDMSDADLKSRASALSLDGGRFGSCLGSGTHDRAIQTAVASGHQLGVTGTPTFFVNGRRLVGARPIEDFQQLIDSELRGGAGS